MNHSGHFDWMDISLMDVVVLIAAAFAVVFFVAWLVSPRLRAWIERPKYRFQSDVRSYEEGLKRR